MPTTLTQYEMDLVTDAEVLLAKNTIIQKVYKLFGELSEDYKNTSISTLPVENIVAAKISRGENYQGLPYVILDYPRQFGKVDVFAIRSFFWWGNFFSITLQLSGKFQYRYASVIQQAIYANALAGWFIGCAEDAWEHHFQPSNYCSVEQTKNYNIANLPHMKIAKKIPLDKWDDAELFFTENFKLLLEVLRS